MSIEECVAALIRMLEAGGILTGGPSDPSGLPMPDGDEIVDLHVDPRWVLPLLFLLCRTGVGIRFLILDKRRYMECVSPPGQI